MRSRPRTGGSRWPECARSSNDGASSSRQSRSSTSKESRSKSSTPRTSSRCFYVSLVVICHHLVARWHEVAIASIRPFVDHRFRESGQRPPLAVGAGDEHGIHRMADSSPFGGAGGRVLGLAVRPRRLRALVGGPRQRSRPQPQHRGAAQPPARAGRAAAAIANGRRGPGGRLGALGRRPRRGGGDERGRPEADRGGGCPPAPPAPRKPPLPLPPAVSPPR